MIRGYTIHTAGWWGDSNGCLNIMNDRQGAQKNRSLILAWIEGATIQILQRDTQGGMVTRWYDDPNPTWESAYTYRVKPERPRFTTVSFYCGEPRPCGSNPDDGDFGDESHVRFVELTHGVREAIKDLL